MRHAGALWHCPCMETEAFTRRPSDTHEVGISVNGQPEVWVPVDEADQDIAWEIAKWKLTRDWDTSQCFDADLELTGVRPID